MFAPGGGVSAAKKLTECFSWVHDFSYSALRLWCLSFQDMLLRNCVQSCLQSKLLQKLSNCCATCDLFSFCLGDQSNSWDRKSNQKAVTKKQVSLPAAQCLFSVRWWWSVLLYVLLPLGARPQRQPCRGDHHCLPSAWFGFPWMKTEPLVSTPLPNLELG